MIMLCMSYNSIPGQRSNSHGSTLIAVETDQYKQNHIQPKINF